MNLNWLRAIHDELWSTRCGSSGVQFVRENQNRALTEQEWETVKYLIIKYNLICVPGNGVFGFGYRTDIWLPADSPTYPGTEDAFKPEFLLSVSDRHLGSLWDMNGGTRSAIQDKFWNEVITPLVYDCCSNVRAATAAFGPLKDRSYYEY